MTWKYISYYAASAQPVGFLNHHAIADHDINPNFLQSRATGT